MLSFIAVLLVYKLLGTYSLCWRAQRQDGLYRILDTVHSFVCSFYANQQSSTLKHLPSALFTNIKQTDKFNELILFLTYLPLIFQKTPI